MTELKYSENSTKNNRVEQIAKLAPLIDPKSLKILHKIQRNVKNYVCILLIHTRD